MATPPKVSCIAIASLFTAFALCLLAAFFSDTANAQPYPKPSMTVENWATLPAGTFLKAWGQTGDAPGEFRTLHTTAIDQRGRVFVGDRSNNRIQLFDQEGTFLAQWTQYGRPSGIFFDAHEHHYVADSESDDVQNPGWEMGIRIGDAHLGWVDYFIRLPDGDPRDTTGNGAEFVSVDAAGNIFGGEPAPRKLQRYVRVRR